MCISKQYLSYIINVLQKLDNRNQLIVISDQAFKIETLRSLWNMILSQQEPAKFLPSFLREFH